MFIDELIRDIERKLVTAKDIKERKEILRKKWLEIFGEYQAYPHTEPIIKQEGEDVIVWDSVRIAELQDLIKIESKRKGKTARLTGMIATKPITLKDAIVATRAICENGEVYYIYLAVEFF